MTSERYYLHPVALHFGFQRDGQYITRSETMAAEATFIIAGIGCVVAAIVGGGVSVNVR
jgi:hypothetical protein